jgi:hypothetical protein
MNKKSIFGNCKRGQNMSVELIFTVALFVSFFVILLAVILSQQSNDLDDVGQSAQSLVSVVSDPIRPPVRIVDTNGSVNVENLLEISNLTSAQLKELFGINAEFCFILVDPATGDVIHLSENIAGVGSPEIFVGGVPCGFNAID